MSRLRELIQEHRNDELWQRCCGFIDLSIDEFMRIQRRLLLEQIELVKKSKLGQKVLRGASPTSVEEFRTQVPFTTYKDYCPELLEQQEQQLATLTQELRNNQNKTQKILVNNNSSESYLELANHYENSGDQQKAIELYTEAIKRNRREAIAYQQRGLLRSQLGDRQGAIQDLRLAAKFYFEQGDLESYEQAKAMTNELYQVKDSEQIPNNDPVILGNLFA